jgi:hypothetical protein
MCDEARESTVAAEHDDVQASTPETITTSEPAVSAAAEPTPPAEPEAPPAEPGTATAPEPPADVQAEAPAAAPPAAIELTPEALAERIARLTQLLDGAEKVLAATDLPDARTRWNALRREWTALIAGVALDEATAARVAEVEGRIEARDAAAREARTRHQQDNLTRLQRLCEEAEKLAQGDQLTLRDAERVLRDIRSALDAPGPLPSRQEQQAIVARLKAVQSQIFPRVQDLREADGWERWANAGVQEALITRLESLREQADPAVIAKQLRNVQDEWHKVRAVPREKGRELWQRYKIIEGELRLRCESFFQQLAVERVENLRKKEALCAQVESLADSTDWIRTAETIKGLQAEWKTIGPVTPGHEKAVWERFRAACDRFFTRRKNDLNERKNVWMANLKKKEAICAQVEALLETTDWDHALAEVKRIQAEWRQVGPVKRNRSEALLARFHAACEKFFDRYAHRNDHEVAQQLAAREQLCADLESVLAAPEGAEPESDEALAKKVLAFKRQWDQGPAITRAQAEPLVARFTAALNAVVEARPAAFKGSELDPEAARKRMEQLCQIVEGFAGDEKAEVKRSPAEILAAQLREALAANTIGGRADDEAKWRNAADEVRKAQAAWRRLGPLPDAAAHDLEARFQKACNRFFKQLDQHRRPSGPPRR